MDHAEDRSLTFLFSFLFVLLGTLTSNAYISVMRDRIGKKLNIYCVECSVKFEGDFCPGSFCDKCLINRSKIHQTKVDHFSISPNNINIML